MVSLVSLSAAAYIYMSKSRQKFTRDPPNQTTWSGGSGMTSGGKSLLSFLLAFLTTASILPFVNLAVANRASSLASGRT